NYTSNYHYCCANQENHSPFVYGALKIGYSRNDPEFPGSGTRSRANDLTLGRVPDPGNSGSDTRLRVG
uniref:Uncharacterized protein n=1 Tax=Acrobeloides nanus TaxID=290746 RepID=A0A914DRD9_9BILA